MNTSPTRFLAVGAAIGVVCLTAGFMLGATLAPRDDPPPVTLDSEIQRQLDMLTRSVKDVLKARLTVPTRAVESDTRPEPTTRELNTATNDDIVAALNELAERIDQLAVKQPLRATDVHGIPTERKPINIQRVEALQQLSPDDALAELVLLTQAQVYAQLGTPTLIEAPGSTILWIYDTTPETRDKQLSVGFQNNVVTRTSITAR